MVVWETALTLLTKKCNQIGNTHSDDTRAFVPIRVICTRQWFMTASSPARRGAEFQRNRIWVPKTIQTRVVFFHSDKSLDK